MNRRLDAKQELKELIYKVSNEIYLAEQQIRRTNRYERLLKHTMKGAAKKGYDDVLSSLASDVLIGRKILDKINAAKPKLYIILVELERQLMVVERFDGFPMKSTEVMVALESLMKIPELTDTILSLSKDILQAGIIDKMVDNPFSEPMKCTCTMEYKRRKKEEEICAIQWELSNGVIGRPSPSVSGKINRSTMTERPEFLRKMMAIREREKDIEVPKDYLISKEDYYYDDRK